MYLMNCINRPNNKYLRVENLRLGVWSICIGCVGSYQNHFRARLPQEWNVCDCSSRVEGGEGPMNASALQEHSDQQPHFNKLHRCHAVVDRKLI